MLMTEADQVLDDILARWHHWARSFRVVTYHQADPMFKNARSSRGWDTTMEIVEDEIEGSILKTVDFQVSEMPDPHRSAIHCLAKNCALGVNVWFSPRLPMDRAEREVIVREARNILTKRLLAAGVL